MTLPRNNKAGRPRVEPSDRKPPVYMHLTLSASLYDSSYEAARRRRMTVPEFLRAALQEATTKDPDR